MTRRGLIYSIIAGLAGLASCSATAADQSGLTVYAASSLTNALQDVGAAFTKDTGIALKFSFAASSLLARQIEAGAPADVFISADEEWMDDLQKHTLIDSRSRKDIASNRLVLISQKDSPLALKIAPGFALKAALGETGRLALADPQSVPAGRYAKAALTALGIWGDVEQRILPTENVRAALLVVERGEAPAGIVYETDAHIDDKVRIVDVFPENSHQPIRYPAAVISTAKKGAARFLDYLAGPKSQVLIQKYGFGRVSQAR